MRDISRGIRSRQKSGRVGSRSRSGWPIPIFQQIGIGSGWPIPTFQQIGIGSRSLSSNFRDKIGENRDFPRVFPSFLGQKHREKSGKIGKNRGKSGNISTFPDFEQKVGKSRDFPDFSWFASTFPDLPRKFYKFGEASPIFQQIGIEIGEASPILPAHSWCLAGARVEMPTHSGLEKLAPKR